MKGYDIKIRLDKVKPLYWRDLIIPAGITFEDLSQIAQISYGFEYEHDYQFIFKDMDLIIEGYENSVPLHFIKELDDYYKSFMYNLADEFIIDYFFDKYKKIKLEVYTRDKWPMTIEVKKIIQTDTPYPVIKRHKGDYNPLEYSCDRLDFTDFLYLQDQPKERKNEYYSKVDAYWDDFKKYDHAKTQEILKSMFDDYFDKENDGNSTHENDDDIKILPYGPNTLTNIDSSLYNESELIGENEYASVYLHKQFMDYYENKPKIAFITGLNPMESQAYRAVFEAIHSTRGLGFISVNQYHINYKKKTVNYKIGEKIIEEIITPHIMENDYLIVIDVHSNIDPENNDDLPKNFIFEINNKTIDFADRISSPMLTSFRPDNYENCEYINKLVKENQKVLYLELSSYENLSILYTICSNMLKAIEEMIYEYFD